MKTIPVWNEVLLSQTCLLRLWWQLPEKMLYSFSLCSEVVALCVGREECFFWKDPLPKCRCLPFHDKISAPGDTRRREDGVCSSGKHGEEQLRWIVQACCIFRQTVLSVSSGEGNVLFWWSRGPPRGAAQPTHTTAHQGLNPILPQSHRQLWRWRRVWMRRCLSEQLSKLRHGRKTRNTGRTEGRERQAEWKGEPRGRQGRGQWWDPRSRYKKTVWCCHQARRIRGRAWTSQELCVAVLECVGVFAIWQRLHSIVIIPI